MGERINSGLLHINDQTVADEVANPFGGRGASADAMAIWIVQWVGSEIRADFQHLRRWRKSVEQAQSYTFKAVITVIATGLMGAVWLGVKVVLGK